MAFYFCPDKAHIAIIECQVDGTAAENGNPKCPVCGHPMFNGRWTGTVHYGDPSPIVHKILGQANRCCKPKNGGGIDATVLF